MADKLDTLMAVCTDAFHVENDVSSRLTVAAEKYIAAIVAILGFHIIEIKDLKFSGDCAALVWSIVVLLGLLLLLIALAVTLWSMRIRTYPTYASTKDLQPLLEAKIDDSSAKESLIDLYLDMRDGILQINQKRAGLIQFAGYSLIVGFLVSMLGQIFLKL